MMKKSFGKNKYVRHFFAYLFFFFTLSIAKAQEITVKGRVLSAETKSPIENASVAVVGKPNKGAITDDKGFFTLKVDKNAKLIIRNVTFTPEEINVNGRTEITINLKPMVQEDNEVVVVGYMTQKKKDIVTSIASVSTKNATEGGYSNFQQIIGGRATGVNVSEANGGEPGGGINIEIRGVSSLGNSTQPLYVIDGLPIDMPNTSNLGNGNANSFVGAGSGAASPLAALNPNDIESIDILKDAAATAIYGSRGSNGVVLITTKSGKAGKTKISINYNEGRTKPLKLIQLLDAKDYATLANEVYRYRTEKLGNAATNVPYTASEIDSLQSYDHQKALLRNSVTRDITISLNGGDARNKFYLSGQYYEQNGMIPTTFLKRYNGKINYEGVVLPKLTLTTSVNITSTQRYGQPTASTINGALKWAPSSPLINPDGSFNRLGNYLYGYGNAYYDDPTWGSIYYNARFTPAQALSYVSTTNNPLLFSSKRGVQNQNANLQILANIGLSYQLSSKFKLAGLLGITSYNALLENYVPTTVILPYSTQKGIATIGNASNSKLLSQLTFSYNEKIGKHSIAGVAVVSGEKAVDKTQSVSSMGFTTNATGFYAIQAGNTPDIPSSGYNSYGLVSAISRITYNYDGKYFFNTSLRADGSSKFADGKKFGYFPSVGTAWKIDREKWFKDLLPKVNEFKLRVSWGLVGNQGISPYATLSTLSSSQVAFGGQLQVAYAPSRVPNPDLTWEKTSSFNVGLDFAILKNRISFSAEAYSKKINNLLIDRALAPSSGFNTMTSNIATIKNEGIEFSVSTVNVKTKKITWTTDFNISFNKNLVEKLNGSLGDYFEPAGGEIVSGVNLFRIQPGQSVGNFYGYKAIGVWTDETIKEKPENFQKGVVEGGRRYADLKPDGILNDSDRTFIGSALPKYFGGFSSTLKYKNFELQAFFSYSVGNQIFNKFETAVGGLGGLNNVPKSTFDKRYRIIYADTDPKEAEKIRANNAVTKVMVAGSNMNIREATDYFIEDGSFIRCRDVTLRYTVPFKYIKRLKLDAVKVYVNLQNLFTITKYSGYNPEVNSGSGLIRGVDDGTSPIGRTIRFGFTVNL